MAARNVTKRPIRDGVLVGVLATPGGAGPAPGVLLLGGAEGGLHEQDAEDLAAHGFTVLALAYFGMPGLPEGLVDIPLEYFSRGLDVLAAQPRTGERFGVTGASRGGEAALLIGAHDERIAAVVSVVGSGLLTAGVDFRLGTLPDVLTGAPASWTIGGQRLPFLKHVIPDEMRDRIKRGLPRPIMPPANSRGGRPSSTSPSTWPRSARAGVRRQAYQGRRSRAGAARCGRARRPHSCLRPGA